MVTQFLTLDPTGTIPNVGLRDFLTTGTIFYVDSNVATAGDGLTPTTAVTTLATAVALATANKGDVIMLMANHAETITGNTEIGVEGLSIIGLGVGDNRPQFTFGTNVTADIEFTSDNIRISNCIFKNDVDDQVAFIEIGAAAYCMVDNCEFIEGSSKQCLIGISLTNAGSDNATISNCKFVSAVDGADSAIEIGAALTGLTVSHCHVWGDYDDACIQNPTSAIATNINIHDCSLANLATGQHSIQLVSACTGFLTRNSYHNDMTQQTGQDAGACFSFECFHCDAVDVSGKISPVVT